MNIRRKYGMMLIGAVMAVFVGTGVVVAQDGTNKDYKTEIVTIAESETHDGALYAGGQSVTVAGTVKGDVYCGAQTVTITGTVEGDLICGAQTIRVMGIVTGDVRVGAQTVTIDGKVGGTATAFAQTVDVASNAVIGRDLNGAAESIVISGKVGRDVLAASEFVTISGVVGRNVSGEYVETIVQDKARVGGDLRYTSEKEAVVANGTVAGEVVRSIPQRENDGGDGGFFVGGAAYFFFSMLLVSLVLVLVAPRVVRTVTDHGVSQLLQSVLVGFFVVFGMPIILLLVAATVIGLPLAGLAFMAWLLVLLLTGPVFGYYLGRVIVRNRTTKPALIMLVGASVLLLSYFVPVLNVFAFLATVTVGSGMIALSLFNRKKPVVEAKKVVATTKTKK